MFEVDKSLTPTSRESALSLVNDEIINRCPQLGIRFKLVTDAFGLYEIMFAGNIVLSDTKFGEKVPSNPVKLVSKLEKIVNQYVTNFQKLTA